MAVKLLCYHAGCAAPHEGIEYNTSFRTSGKQTGFHQLRRIGGVVLSLERDGIDDPDIPLVAQRVNIRITDFSMLAGDG